MALQLAERSRPGAYALGTQLLVEMHECLAERLDDVEWVKTVLVEAAVCAQATIVDILFHKFHPVGVSGVVVIAESHIAIHTWPEHRYAALDIFSCSQTLKGVEAASFIIERFHCAHSSMLEVRRGVLPSGAVLKTRLGLPRP